MGDMQFFALAAFAVILVLHFACRRQRRVHGGRPTQPPTSAEATAPPPRAVERAGGIILPRPKCIPEPGDRPFTMKAQPGEMPERPGLKPCPSSPPKNPPKAAPKKT